MVSDALDITMLRATKGKQMKNDKQDIDNNENGQPSVRTPSTLQALSKAVKHKWCIDFDDDESTLSSLSSLSTSPTRESKPIGDAQRPRKILIVRFSSRKEEFANLCESIPSASNTSSPIRKHKSSSGQTTTASPARNKTIRKRYYYYKLKTQSDPRYQLAPEAVYCPYGCVDNGKLIEFLVGWRLHRHMITEHEWPKKVVFRPRKNAARSVVPNTNNHGAVPTTNTHSIAPKKSNGNVAQITGVEMGGDEAARHFVERYLKETKDVAPIDTSNLPVNTEITPDLARLLEPFYKKVIDYHNAAAALVQMSSSA